MQSLSFGQTISRASGLIGATLKSVGLFVVIFQIINLAVTAVFRAQLSASLQAGTMSPLGMFQSGTYWAMLVFSVGVATFAAAVGTYGLLQADRGEPVSVQDCAKRGLARLLPALGLMILTVLGVYAGLFLLVVPGCILLSMWSVCYPVLMGENTGIIEALGRSRALTKGSRWTVFGIFLAIFLLYGVVGAASFLMNPDFGNVAARMSPPLLQQVIGGALNAVLTLVAIAVPVAIYRELIDLKGEGVSNVFD
jgi:hypothetical protein